MIYFYENYKMVYELIIRKIMRLNKKQKLKLKADFFPSTVFY